jgi:outer membrane protein assembly factor BamB
MALDLQSKKLLWRYTPKDRQFPLYSSAAIADGKVVLGGRDKMVHALEARTGNRSGRSPRAPASTRRQRPPAAAYSSAPTTAASTGSISPAARKSGNTKPPRP